MLNVRSSSSWLRSVSRWGDLRARYLRAALEGKPAGIGSTDAHLLDWYQGAIDYIQWSFGHRDDFVLLNISDSGSFARLFAMCNDSRRHFPFVDPRRAQLGDLASSQHQRRRRVPKPLRGNHLRRASETTHAT